MICVLTKVYITYACICRYKYIHNYVCIYIYTLSTYISVCIHVYIHKSLWVRIHFEQRCCVLHISVGCVHGHACCTLRPPAPKLRVFSNSWKGVASLKVDSKQLEYGPRSIYAGAPSCQAFGVAGQSSSIFLASTGIQSRSCELSRGSNVVAFWL